MGEHYAAIVRAVQARLATSGTYGRDGLHRSGACPRCHINVCLNHHTCPKSR